MPPPSPSLLAPMAAVLLLGATAPDSHAAADSVLVFNEIHYHPAPGGADSEWVELHNLMGVDLDVSGWRLRGGVDFDFPEGTVVDGHGFLVIAADPAAPALAAASPLGPFSGALDNGGETLRLENRNGRTMDEVAYDDAGSWPSGPDGSGATLAKLDQRTGDSRPANWVASHPVGGTPGARNFPLQGAPPETVETVVSDWDAVWRYNESDDLAPGWEDSAHPVGGNWAAGPGALGFEGSDTAVPIGTQLTHPSINSPFVVTYYFEREFALSQQQLDRLAGLEVEHLFDDGGVVYINGAEVFRHGMPPGAVGPETLADGTGDPVLGAPVGVPTGSLVAGTNRVSVEVHQGSIGSSDVLFALRLTLVEQPPDAPEPEATLAFNEISAFDDPAGLRVELTNLSSSPVDLAGHTVAWSEGGSHPVAAGVLEPGAHLVLDAATMGFAPGDDDRLFLFGPGGGLIDARRVTGRLRGRADAAEDGSWLYPSAPTFGAPNVFEFEGDIVINEIMFNPRPEPAVAGVPATFQTVALVDWGAQWRFNESGSDLGTGWDDVAHAVGGGWEQGPGPLGWETSDLEVPLATMLTLPAANNPRVITYYFESEFVLTSQQANAVSELQLVHQIDDGAVFYLNGSEIARYEMPPGEVTAATLSDGTGDAVVTGPVTVDRSALVAGTNRLSVEVHQASADSSDVVFGLQLLGAEEITPAVPGKRFRNSDAQWVELHNKSADRTVDLSGWAFDDGIGFGFPQGTALEPGGYLVVARDAAALGAQHPGARVLGDFTGSLSRSGERLRLVDAAGNPADEVRYADGGRWPGEADSGGSSAELRDPHADNAAPGAWAASGERHRGSWKSFVRTGPATNGPGDPAQYHEFIFGLLDGGEFLIDDISVIENPGTGSARELVQNGTFSSGTADTWRLRGNHRHFDVIDDPDAPGNKVLHVRASGTAEHMHNCVETTLKDGANYVTINASSEYQVAFRARWLSGSNQLNSRLYFNRLPRTVLLPVGDPQGGGTPGAPNSRLVPNMGPTILAAAHDPAVPAPGAAATVTAEISDPDGIGSAALFYSVDGSPFQQTAMVGGGGRYVGMVPGQAAGTKVQFYVEAHDSAGAASLFPAAGPASRALIPWEDNQARLQIGDVFPNNFRIVMTDADATFMHTVTEVMSNDRLPCTVIYNEEEIYYGCGVRLKGSQRGRAKDVRVGFNVSFPSDQPFLGCHKTVAVDRSGAGDQFSQKEILIKHVINHAGGVPGMSDDLIWVVQPRAGRASSAMLLKSRFDNEWLDNRFEDGGDGRLFEYELIYYPTSTTGGPEGLKLPNPDSVTGVPMRNQGGTDKELYRHHWQMDNNKDADDYSGLIDMLTAMGLSGPDYLDALEDGFDVDNWLRAFAVQSLGGIGDNYSSGAQHNALFFIRPGDGKAMYFPWDMDFTFSAGATSGVLSNGDLSKMVGASPAYQRLYYGHLFDIIQTTFNTGYLTPWANHYSEFLPSENLAGFLGYINTRAGHVTNLVNNAVANVPFRTTTSDGGTTAGSTTTLRGDAWVDVRSLRLAGATVPLDVTWTDNNSWEVTVPVAPGSNSYTIEALGFGGSVIGTAEVSVVGTGSVVPATAGNLAISEIMFHPPPPTAGEISAGFADGEDFEFVELANLSETLTLDLTGIAFVDGISFPISAGPLAPGGRLVVAGNPAAFTHRYGTAPTASGGYHNPDGSNKLSNAGERVVLTDASGIPIADFEFGDAAPWPVSADGDGYSLVLMNPGSNDPSAPESWRTSAAIGGNPGADDAIPLAAWTAAHGVTDLAADDDLDGLAALVEYAAGRDPARPDAAAIMEADLVQDPGGPASYLHIVFRHHIGADEVRLGAELGQSLGAWGSEGVVYAGRTNNGDGTESVSFRAPLSAGVAPQQFMRVSLVATP